MLTAVRAMAHRVAQDLAHIKTQRLDEGVDSAEQDRLLAEVLERALAAGDEAVKRGPEQLAVLRDAGVVDAGAYGLTVIVAGVIAALRGEDPPELDHQAAPILDRHVANHESSRFRFCTNFVVEGKELDGPVFVPRLEEIGDSVLVVGDARTLKVHVHTDEPGDAVALFEPAGKVSHLDVADMREQVAERDARLEGHGAVPVTTHCGAVAVVNGPGIAGLYHGLGANVVDGGPTLNPSTYDILAGIHATPAHEVIVLPNSPNVILAAERAAEMSEKPARVIPTRSQQAGLSGLMGFDGGRSAEENAAAVAGVVELLKTGGVAEAARDDPRGRFAAGDAVGYAGEELVAWGDPATTLARVIEHLAEGCEVLTCIAGEGAPVPEEAVAGMLPEGVELDYHEGGQPAWWWLLCAE
jgi:dihydroxyacetone kinase-like predicted kinase